MGVIYLAAPQADDILYHTTEGLKMNEDGTYTYQGIPVIVYQFADNHMVTFKVNVVASFPIG